MCQACSLHVIKRAAMPAERLLRHRYQRRAPAAVMTEENPPHAAGLEPRWEGGLAMACASRPRALPVLPAGARTGEWTVCTLPIDYGVPVPWEGVPPGKSSHAPWTRCHALESG